MKKNSPINKYKNVLIILLIIAFFHFFYIEHFNEEDNLIDSGCVLTSILKFSFKTYSFIKLYMNFICFSKLIHK